MDVVQLCRRLLSYRLCALKQHAPLVLVLAAKHASFNHDDGGCSGVAAIDSPLACDLLNSSRHALKLLFQELLPKFQDE